MAEAIDVRSNWFVNHIRAIGKPICDDCSGDGFIYFDGENIEDKCEHCEGKGYITSINPTR